MLPTLAPEPPDGKNLNQKWSGASAGPDQLRGCRVTIAGTAGITSGTADERVHLPRARRHTDRSLRDLRHATAAPERRDGYAQPHAPAELIAAVPAWSSRRAMVRILRGLAKQPAVQAACRRAEIAVETWLAISINDALDADGATGRGICRSQVVAGAAVNRSAKTVQRARALNVRLGLLVEVYRGRELTKDERLSLVRAHGTHGQRGLPNVYAMTVCPARQRHRITIPRPGQFAQVIGFVHLPPEGGRSPHPHLLNILTIAAAAASEESEPPPAAQPGRTARPGIVQAYDIVGHPALRVLLSQVRAGSLAPQLVPYLHGGWSGGALADALADEATYRHVPTDEPARSPHGLLKMLLAGIDINYQMHASGGLAFAPPEPCGAVGCDYGWITHSNGAVSKCPDCPPAVRGMAAW